MLPIRASVLRLDRTAEYWSRELIRVRTTAEIEGELRSAFWRDELELVYEISAKAIDREAVLRGINMRRDHPGFTLVDGGEMIPAPAVEDASGGVTIDLRRYIVLPSDPAQWTDEILCSAYDAMAEVELADFDELIKPAIRMFSVTRDALAGYCDRIGCDRPRFWFGAERGRKWIARLQRDAETWLKQIASGPKRKPKSAYFADALERFPGLPRKAFDRIWNRVVPLNWKRSGPTVR